MVLNGKMGIGIWPGKMGFKPLGLGFGDWEWKKMSKIKTKMGMGLDYCKVGSGKKWAGKLDWYTPSGPSYKGNRFYLDLKCFLTGDPLKA